MSTTQLELTTFDQLVELSRPHIKHYIEDLMTHDRNWIDGNPGTSFLHFTRECGTDLLPLYPSTHVAWPQKGEKVPYLFGFATREHILLQTKEVAKYRAEYGMNKLSLYYDGSSFKQITTAQAVEIAEAHRQMVLYAWNNNQHVVTLNA